MSKLHHIIVTHTHTHTVYFFCITSYIVKLCCNLFTHNMNLQYLHTIYGAVIHNTGICTCTCIYTHNTYWRLSTTWFLSDVDWPHWGHVWLCAGPAGKDEMDTCLQNIGRCESTDKRTSIALVGSAAYETASHASCTHTHAGPSTTVRT